MIRSLAVAVLAIFTTLPVFAQREFGFDNRKPSGQPYLSPEETVKRMKVAPEFEVKLFAGEPQVVNPVAFTIDEKGRIWVVECFEYPSRTPPGKAPRDRIVILEDTDGDGQCDKRTVFAEGKDFPVPEERKKKGLGAFDLCTGIEVGYGGVFVGAAPYLWFIENKNDKPGKFDVLLKGFGSEDTHETLNTFQWGPDGWLYGLHGIFTQSNVSTADGEPAPPTKMNAAVWRFHPKTKKFEIFAEGTSNPWGMDWRNTDGQFILACCVIPHLYHIVPGGIYQRQAGASNNPYVYEYIKEISDHTFHRESGWAHAGLLSLDVPHMPAKYRNSVIFGSIHGCSIKQNILKPNGSSYTASKGEDFLVSSDKNFRPINLRWGPNGDIYLIDWHDQNPCHQAAAGSWDYERGRVYRIQLKNRIARKICDFGSLTRQEVSDLIKDTSDTWQQRSAMRMLCTIKTGTLEQLADFPNFTISSIWQARIAEMCDPLFSSDITLFAMLPAEDKNVCASAIRGLSESPSNMMQAYITSSESKITLKSAVTRRELASAGIRIADTIDVSRLVHALMTHTEDANDPLIPHLTWIAYEKVLSSRKHQEGAPGSLDSELKWLASNAPGNPFITDRIIPKVMRRLVATGKKDDLALCLKFVSELSDATARKQALSGLAIALKDQVVDAPPTWAALQPELRKDDLLIPLVNQLAVSFRDPEAVRRAFLTMRDASQPDSARAEAIRQLTMLKPDNVNKAFVTILRQGFPEAVKVEAARGLVVFDDPTLPEQLFKLWADASPAVRAELVNTLASRKNWAKALLTAMKSGAVDRTLATDRTITRIQAFNDRELNGLIESAWGKTRKTPAELQTLIDKTRAELDATPASFTRGKVAFDNFCSKCHQFDGRGQTVGPPLDGAGRDIDYILANVIDPNRVIGAPYFLRTATRLDGRVEQGILAEEDDRSITLKVEQGQLRKILKSELDGAVKVQEKSMMPEGLTAGMTPADFRDLVRYVMANPFVTRVTLNGQPVTAGVTGKIPLPNKAGPVTIQFQVESTSAMKTKLLLGCTDGIEVRQGETVIGRTGSAPRRAAPDMDVIDVTLPQGVSKFTLTVQHKGAGEAVYLRFADPERRLKYEE